MSCHVLSFIRLITSTCSQPLPPCGSSVFLAEYQYGNSFYSFEAGLAHVIFLNPYTASDVLSPQYQFLLADLSLVNRQHTPWIIGRCLYVITYLITYLLTYLLTNVITRLSLTRPHHHDTTVAIVIVI